ncbi:MAG TPA: NAD-dependent epimerase/dehydratase family protein [Candidatus Baltobacteraceae bacterium]|nr:NAD-dependent epimerase/dehydratase family protein [Candidatus Baltobacteraceae bacterium]
MSADRVFLTGATGFVGSHVLRELVAAGYEVVALRRASTGSAVLRQAQHDTGAQRDVPAQRDAIGQREAVTWIEGDLENVGAFASALRGCRYVVHCAALYSFAPADRGRMHRVNVVGTASLSEAARVAGVERFVHTSSSATLGASHDGTPLDETHFAHDDGASGYHHSKVEQERAAFAGRVPVIALLPTAPVGPGDVKPTPTGQMILDFARGKMFSKPPRGGLNLVPVEDVARAHVTALTHGRTGERYILGGENLTLDRVWELLAEVTGKPMPSFRAPHALAMAIAYADEARCRIIPDSTPFVPLEGVRMSVETMFADSSKARTELNFTPGPVRAALERSVQWFRTNGYA